MAPSSHGHERGCIFRGVLDCDKTKYIEHEWISADCEPVQSMPFFRMENGGISTSHTLPRRCYGTNSGRIRGAWP